MKKLRKAGQSGEEKNGEYKGYFEEQNLTWLCTHGHTKEAHPQCYKRFLSGLGLQQKTLDEKGVKKTSNLGLNVRWKEGEKGQTLQVGMNKLYMFARVVPVRGVKMCPVNFSFKQDQETDWKQISTWWLTLEDVQKIVAELTALTLLFGEQK